MATRKTTSRKTTPRASSAQSATTKSTTAKSTAAKSTAAKASGKTAPKTTAATVTAAKTAPKTTDAPAVEAKPAAPAGPAALRKKELLERVKARAGGVKGSDVRVVMDAVLDELGALLVDGDGLNAQPLGVLKVQKHRLNQGADIVVCKLRRKKRDGAGKDPLADAAE